MNDTLSLLNSAVLSALCKSLMDGDYKLIESMGITPSSIEKLRDLSLANAQLLCRAPGHILSISIDELALNNYLNYLDKRKQQQKLIQSLLLADAPSAYIKEQFGIRREEYIAMRNALGMQAPKRGRSSLPENREVIAAALYRTQNLTEDGILSPEQYLSLYKTYEVNIRELIALDQALINEEH